MGYINKRNKDLGRFGVVAILFHNYCNQKGLYFSKQVGIIVVYKWYKISRHS